MGVLCNRLQKNNFFYKILDRLWKRLHNDYHKLKISGGNRNEKMAKGITW